MKTYILSGHEPLENSLKNIYDMLSNIFDF